MGCGSAALGLIIGFFAAILAGRIATAGDGCGNDKCPSCDYVCEMTIDHSPAKKHCWKIEYKRICVPKVTFPWQRGCGSCGKGGNGGKGCTGCAKIKYVKVLVKHQYEYPSCQYKFTPAPCGKRCKDADDPVMGGDSGDGGAR